MDKNKVTIVTASQEHFKYAEKICETIEDAAKIRGTGIAKRKPEYIRSKMREGKAVIALTSDGRLAGFCYIESWGKEKNYVANSGLIVVPEFRELGLGKMIKKAAFELSRKKYPHAKLFGITTSPAVMKINYQLGYRPVTFAQLTDDEEFWKGCESCVNFDILQRTNRKHCLCTAMLFDPEEKKKNKTKESEVINEQKSSVGL
ncbi:GNAT family N-acetyltransferase [Caldithrix abyssi]|uniref:Acetyltransferase (GNAT) family protein n=1 Tax=Caldithrix abyssi DSM 13497 TaxID=880073 RepID=H1XRZ0_CALAY|nr:GNAT family N-acetyltransferase [Caldithrix abyssi]APF18481.1 L-amino acid N-acyltransferase YncA [Caldithrix abyssi DSM 13497]EHO42483.1 acetyltransferase (GNAT) family protein [Caldithrix abyssi DSM 13497]